MSSFYFRELQLITVLILICHSYMSWSTRFFSLKLPMCGNFCVRFFLFLLKFIFLFNKMHGLFDLKTICSGEKFLPGEKFRKSEFWESQWAPIKSLFWDTNVSIAKLTISFTSGLLCGIDINLGQKIWRLFHFLTQLFFTTSETELDYDHQKVSVRVASRVAELLKT